ncbi:MAG: DNA/RNA nuclease SfsA [Clostridia bacterium]|nr:DNA/RNA nuclease SfsA [Clostridia bacterium]
MKYSNIVKGEFLSRPNRFIAKVNIDGETHTVHVKNTGRCKELLVSGATVYLEKSSNPHRKTAFDLVAVEKKRDKDTLLINMDSQVVNDVAEEWLRRGNLFSADAKIRREVTYNKSRFDFYIEDNDKKAFLEVKGVTLENGGIASFPDAPTERGIKHLCELESALGEGYEAYVLFVIQMKGVSVFKPNDLTHKAFGDTLRTVSESGVKVIAVDCNITPDSIEIDNFIDIDLR